MFSIFVVLIGYCLGLKPLRVELIGLVLTIVGVALMFSDPTAERTDGKKASTFTYAVCIFGAFLASFFILMNGLLVKSCPIFLLLLLQGAIGFVYTAFFMKFMEPEKYIVFSIDKEWGGLGFLNKEHFLETFVFYGQSGGFWGNAGYIICLLFFSPVIVSAVYLIEPFLG